MKTMLGRDADARARPAEPTAAVSAAATTTREAIHIARVRAPRRIERSDTAIQRRHRTFVPMLSVTSRLALSKRGDHLLGEQVEAAAVVGDVGEIQDCVAEAE